MRVAARNKWWLAAALLLSLSAARAAPRGRLLRVPKVYNALITSNEPLLPSRTEQATVGQVLYYPPHHTYPASSGPLILPQVTPHQPPLLYDPRQPQQQHQQQGPQQLVSLPQDGQQEGQQQPLELHVQPGLTQEQVALAQEQDQSTPWPVVYASDVQQQQPQQPHPQQHLQQQQQLQQQQLPQDAAGQPPAPFPAARAVQTVEEVAHPGEYQPPPAVDIDSIKNNRPSGEGIRDVPPPPLPVGRGNKDGHRPQPIPPGLLPF
ncbi:nuclear transcription factor Y subunit beta [Frankliniella occidentalis]|uniref:Nuclear transcription factor Y subunit beta n=1 Tax=Frankliniella occidentalis TaxID=133901 RepID=A0A6J1SXM7_FRAOC|nr:nuclear transcription factor Y subunit beta [Frankliniella occidentalis]